MLFTPKAGKAQSDAIDHDHPHDLSVDLFGERQPYLA